MAVAKVIELIAKSEIGWEDAVQQGVKEASKSVKNITQVYAQDFVCKVEDDCIKEYKATLKVTFVVDK